MVVIAKDELREPLHVVTTVYNPLRLKSRWKNAERAIKHFVGSGAVVTLVEIGFNRRELVFADSGLDGKIADCGLSGGEFKHKYIGLHTKDELWLKESAINIGVQNLPYGWQQVAWIDADTTFCRPNWVGECIHKLQHGTSSDIAFCQMFSHAADLGPNYEILPASYPNAQGVSFIKAWQDGDLKTTMTKKILEDLKAIGGDIRKLATDFMTLEEDLAGNYYGQDKVKKVWSGLAYACTRKAWDAVGGLPEYALWGGADWQMAHSLIGKSDGMMRGDLHDNYKKLAMEWHERCQVSVRRNVVTMDGSILHHWHGRKENRNYNLKHRLMAKWGYDPLRHIKRDASGLPQLHDDGSEMYIQLRDQLRAAARSRNEDGNEI